VIDPTGVQVVACLVLLAVLFGILLIRIGQRWQVAVALSSLDFLVCLLCASASPRLAALVGVVIGVVQYVSLRRKRKSKQGLNEMALEGPKREASYYVDSCVAGLKCPSTSSRSCSPRSMQHRTAGRLPAGIDLLRGAKRFAPSRPGAEQSGRLPDHHGGHGPSSTVLGAARNAGKPTAHAHALDADRIIAAFARIAAAGGIHQVTVATKNLRPISQFVPADL
jgi:hypothetical protein